MRIERGVPSGNIAQKSTSHKMTSKRQISQKVLLHIIGKEIASSCERYQGFKNQSVTFRVEFYLVFQSQKKRKKLKSLKCYSFIKDGDDELNCVLAFLTFQTLIQNVLNESSLSVGFPPRRTDICHRF